MAKIASDQAALGDSGVHLIARVVGEMGHLWHPTVGVDSGIDGEIELRDPGTREVRNVRIGVQSKATASKWERETARSFSYRPRPKDVAYWLSSNQPVLLVCARPSSNEAYWRSMQEWVRDPIERASGRVRFDKERDRFDASAAAQLFDLKASPQDRVEPPGPAPEPEELLTNLMPIRWRADQLWSVAITENDPVTLFQPAWDAGIRHDANVVRQGRVWSFTPFAPSFIATIGGAELSGEPLGPSVESDNTDRTNLIRQLIVRTIASRHSELRWHGQKRVLYFARRQEQQDVKYVWGPGAGRAVVSAQFSKAEDAHFMGYRHDAAELAVRKTAAGWVLQVIPTYLFTWDGRQLSGHHDAALAGIKKIERHKAVSLGLRMWEHMLHDPEPTLEDQTGRPDFEVGELLRVDVSRGIDEKAWERLSDEEALEAEGTLLTSEQWAQDTIFEPDDYVA